MQMRISDICRSLSQRGQTGHQLSRLIHLSQVVKDLFVCSNTSTQKKCSTCQDISQPKTFFQIFSTIIKDMKSKAYLDFVETHQILTQARLRKTSRSAIKSDEPPHGLVKIWQEIDLEFGFWFLTENMMIKKYFHNMTNFYLPSKQYSSSYLHNSLNIMNKMCYFWQQID